MKEILYPSKSRSDNYFLNIPNFDKGVWIDPIKFPDIKCGSEVVVEWSNKDRQGTPLSIKKAYLIQKLRFDSHINRESKKTELVIENVTAHSDFIDATGCDEYADVPLTEHNLEVLKGFYDYKEFEAEIYDVLNKYNKIEAIREANDFSTYFDRMTTYAKENIISILQSLQKTNARYHLFGEYISSIYKERLTDEGFDTFLKELNEWIAIPLEDKANAYIYNMLQSHPSIVLEMIGVDRNDVVVTREITKECGDFVDTYSITKVGYTYTADVTPLVIEMLEKNNYFLTEDRLFEAVSKLTSTFVKREEIAKENLPTTIVTVGGVKFNKTGNIYTRS
jgi:hypothetical protein